MRCPNAKKLSNTFKITMQQANLIKRVAKAADDAEALKRIVDKNCPETVKYVASMHSSPYHSSMWRTTVALDAINHIIGGYGVESLGPVRMQGPPYEYINMGDTYATTLIYKHATDNLFIGDWGSIVEREDRRGEW